MTTKKVFVLAVDNSSPINVNLVPSDERKKSFDDRKKSLFPVLDPRRGSVHPSQLVNLLAAKKAGKKIGKSEKRETSPFQTIINYEPTYRMEPNTKFQAHQVYGVIKDTLDDRLDGFQYNAKITPTLSQVLTDEIKERVKPLCLDRYKLIVTIILGEKKEQGVMVTSRCAWEPKYDNYATYSYQNKSVFCTATVYGIYTE